MLKTREKEGTWEIIKVQKAALTQAASLLHHGSAQRASLRVQTRKTVMNSKTTPNERLQRPLREINKNPGR